MLAAVLLFAQKPTAAEIRAKADRLVAAGRYAEASAAFLEASRRYTALGDPNAGIVLRDFASRYRTEAEIYVDRPAAISSHLARLEPAAGCYLGVSVEREDGAGRDPATFDSRIGRDHAIFFMYRRFGSPFPTDLARKLRRIGAGLQLAWEPGSLAEVYDERKLNEFLGAAAHSGIPVFLRFASEMNGPWTPYHGDPAAYREAFRYVAAKAHAAGENLAMVWCPAAIPEQGIDDYYPGPEAVDWVGVNFYSVLYNDGDRARAAQWRHPADSLDYVYRRYAGRHPMMVGEWAATHRSVVDGAEKPEFAIDKIGQFYETVPRKYPRVKAIHWLSADTIKYAQGARKLNDFTLLSNASVAEAYSRAVADPYYLGHATDVASVAPERLSDGDVLPARAVLSAHVRSYVARPKTLIKVDGKVVLDERTNGSHRVEVALSAGKHTIVLAVFDDQNRLAGKRACIVKSD